VNVFSFFEKTIDYFKKTKNIHTNYYYVKLFLFKKTTDLFREMELIWVSEYSENLSPPIQNNTIFSKVSLQVIANTLYIRVILEAKYEYLINFNQNC